MPLVIFIDDSETALASTKMVTNSMPIEVKQYLHAEDALADIKGGLKPDLIITDLNMPVMNGLEFSKEMRAFSTVPILMLTTETNPDLKAQAKVLKLTGWIIKPFKPAQLKTAITRVLRLPA